METNEIDFRDVPAHIPLPGVGDEATREAFDYVENYFKFIGVDTDADGFLTERPTSLPDDVAKAWDILDISRYNVMVDLDLIFMKPDGKPYTLDESGELVPYEIPEGVRKWMSENKPTEK